MTYKLGEKSQAVCWYCKGIRPTTFRLRDHLQPDNTVLVDVLVAVCDICGYTVAIPQQSCPQKNNR